ncbi:uncharacterized protein LOC129774381 [Toxorhynchites rutilus septentrionalis]|uniref:uncharacterized protein LOC129774381 n=1 Tax=Toxorhynchites rutilus septentrionalis TaxID=329112 RepID=UPI002479A604|nr:uncharacterized protein LOC129774381 [Toxorhynchites rutilus septentrionalis]
MPSQILHDDLWWQGPRFLRFRMEQWPEQVIMVPERHIVNEEARSVLALHVCVSGDELFDRFSELSKLIKFVAYCHRFRSNCRTPKDQRSNGPLSSDECEIALKNLIRITQHSAFPLEVKSYALAQDSPRIPKSPLRNLNLLMDNFGLLRIDSRIRNSNAPFDSRFPILLPSNHKLSFLIARATHLKTLHGGPSLLLATLRQRYWPLRGRNLVRKVVRRCVTCFRCQPKPTTQIMAPLPAVRLTPARPFSYTGLDYCGPFYVRPLNGRGVSVKVYVALFVCLVVKAVHIEVVVDLSAASCINAVNRIVARRGRIIELHCDNATAFVGANREFIASRNEFLHQFKGDEWRHHCLHNGIRFRFIPARSPHFGGLWDAGVKSFKHHFRRIMGPKAYTMDHFLTILAQVEATLNSRPLSPLSDSPDDLDVLTPAHFLIGEPLVTIAEPDLSHIKPGRLDRFQEMKKSTQDLWTRWSRDYRSQLHQRTKWRNSQTNLKPGQLVLLKDNTPPLQWPLGRIVETIPGKDGHVRVVVVKTATGQYKRAVTEVSVLPTDPDAEDESEDVISGAQKQSSVG